MGAQPEQRRLRFNSAAGKQDRLAISLVIPSRREVRRPTGKTLQANDRKHLEASFLRLDRQLLGAMEERSREPVRPVLRVAVLAVVQVSFDHVAELRVEQEASGETVEQRRKARDRGREDVTPGANDASSLGEGEDAVAPVGEVIERAKDQHGVVAGLGKRKMPSVSDVSDDTTAGRPQLASGDNVVGYGVDDVHVMPVLRQPGGVDSLGTTDIEDVERPTWEVPSDHFPCPNELELCEAVRDAPSFIDRVVVAEDLVRKVRHPYMEPEWRRAAVAFFPDGAICSHGERRAHWPGIGSRRCCP